MHAVELISTTSPVLLLLLLDMFEGHSKFKAILETFFPTRNSGSAVLVTLLVSKYKQQLDPTLFLEAQSELH